MQFIFMMRYSYFGRSDWRSPVSQNPGELFSRDRLAHRFNLFEKVALQSLADQTDKDFKLLLLSSEGLPERHKTLLRDVTADKLGSDRVHLMFEDPDMAGTRFRRYLKTNLNDTHMTSQIVLDDDDAVATNYVEVLRREALTATALFQPGQEHTYVSFPKGVTANFGDNGVQVHHRTSPFTALGLALISPTMAKRNAYFIAHKRIARRHPVRMIYSQAPMYIRSLHGMNDSRGLFDDDQLSAVELDDLHQRFPLLHRFKVNQTQPELQLAG